MLTLHHADELEPLLRSLAGVLAPPLSDPFTPHVVAVPSAGTADAVMAALGARLGSTGRGDGIVANVNFLFPGQFVARALGAATTDDDPWSIERLTWTVLQILEAQPSLLPWATDGGAGAGASAGRDPWALARRIADLFDQYASQRPALITSWGLGEDTDGTFLQDGQLAPLDAGHLWQARLWREVRKHIDTPSPPERLPHYLEQMRLGAIQPNLPERVSVFGFGSLSFTFLSLLRSLAQVREVHVFLRHPSRVAWASSVNRLAGAVQVRVNLDVAAHVNHPLLVSWGRPALEARALTAGMPDVVERAVDTATSAPRSLLGHLQHGIRHDVAPAPVGGLALADHSLQVHACHGDLRQLEVLRDALGHAFVADPTLQAHDVLVLCPDLERFAPLVESVLGRGSLPVPARVGDRSLTTEDSLADVLQAALQLVEGRATLTQVLSLAQSEPVRTRFGWEADHIGQLANWCTELGTRWGLLAEHRVQWGIPSDIVGGTWLAMSERLLAGAALSAPADRAVLGNVVPFDDMGSDDVALAGTMADFLARLVWLHEQVGTPRPIAEWVDTLHAVVDHFCAVPKDEHWRIAALHGVLDEIRITATGPHGTSAVPLGIADVKAVLANHLADRPGRLRLRSGAVTVTSLIPLRGVPARVVCILGLDEGAVRTGNADGDDVLGSRPCVGERHPRLESRHLLLDAVLAAQDRLIVTCNGADLTTNKEVPFIVALAELLDTVNSVRGENGPQVVIRHPRHGFHEGALTTGSLLPGSDQPFTFDPQMLAAAQARRKAHAPQPASGSDGTVPVSPWALAPRPVGTVNIDRAVSAIVNPGRTYLRERLDVRLPGDTETLDDGLPIGLDPLGTSALGRALLEARRHGVGFDEWSATVRLTGTLPPGDLSTAALDAVIGEVQDFEAVLQAWSVDDSTTDEVDIALQVDVRFGEGDPTAVQLMGKVVGVSGTRVADTRYARPRASQRLGLALRLAALQVQHPETDWSAVLVTRKASDSDRATPAIGLRFRGVGAERSDTARAFLVRGLQVFEWALRDAVPLFERASEAMAGANWGSADTHLENDLKDDAVGFLWADTSVDDLRDAPLCAGDPPGLGADSGAGRGVAVAEWVWGLLHESVEYVDHNGVALGASDDEDGGEA